MAEQIKFVKKHLEKKNSISRNYCLANYISRLGAIIKELENEGYVFDSRPSSTGTTMLNGFYKKGDYVYYLVAKPKK